MVHILCGTIPYIGASGPPGDYLNGRCEQKHEIEPASVASEHVHVQLYRMAVYSV